MAKLSFGPRHGAVESAHLTIEVADAKAKYNSNIHSPTYNFLVKKTMSVG